MALSLARSGFDIALHTRQSNQTSLAAVEEIQGTGARCRLFPRDLDNIDEVVSLLPEIATLMGAPSLLVNNASIFAPQGLLDATPEDFASNFNIHVRAPFFLSAAFARLSCTGQIINIVDAAVGRFSTDYFAYLLSKKALLSLTEMSACQLAPSIRVNAIAPGLISPPQGCQAEQFEQGLEANLLARAPTERDIIQALNYLLSAEHVTGQCLFVDGGDHIDY